MFTNYQNAKITRRYDAKNTSNKAKSADNSKRRLIRNLEKKFKTTIIGALHHIELSFGHLWGFESDSPMTRENREYEELWQELRTEILNNGNNQLRACLDELAQYTVSWDKYQAQFIVSNNLSDKPSILQKDLLIKEREDNYDE